MKKKAKKAVKKAVKKARKTRKPKLACRVCGLVVSVDRDCGCVDTCDIVCCGEQMKQKK
jgi:hypothetical protein